VVIGLSSGDILNNISSYYKVNIEASTAEMKPSVKDNPEAT